MKRPPLFADVLANKLRRNAKTSEPIMKRRKRTKRLLHFQWDKPQLQKHGNTFWETEDGRFRIVKFDRYDEISYPTVYVCWRLLYFKGAEQAGWHWIGDKQGKLSAVKLCEKCFAADCE